ncbi:UNKNOWN [Stylonychia lemnae]|uniref:Uncharacterized protein n=1 Tax=Stylonychia lemnae TaxID=5949 RepID=A0A078B5H4_STYLE|nr:UNKNOWN [Stylonychia lemnae]|eukprot:CDW89775.1 UNKNOWN [Stylonychia lemnae]
MELSIQDFRFYIFTKIYNGECGPEILSDKGYANKLNVIFDIDHTLVYSINADQCPQLAQNQLLPRIKLAPKDNYQQKEFQLKQKDINDFKQKISQDKMFDKENCIIIDDQVMAVKDSSQSKFILSMKFMKNFEMTSEPQRTQTLIIFNYPKVWGIDNNSLHPETQTFHQDVNKQGELNQLYYIGLVISKLYLRQFTLQPEKTFTQILNEYKKEIFKEIKFFLNEFNYQVELTRQNDQTQSLIERMIVSMGGTISNSKTVSNYCVYRKKSVKVATGSHFKFKPVYYKFVSDSYFMMTHLDSELYKIKN